ncbi:hypothetical protein MPH_13497, partial [Macrophomina phaseolina MS6]
MDDELNSSFTNLSVEDSLTTEVTSRSRNTRGTAASATRAHCRQPGLNKPEKEGKNRPFYCKYCTNGYRSQASNTFRNHFASVHGITVVEEPGAI